MNHSEKQEVLNLRDEGKSYREIASILSVSENTIKSFFKRTKESLVCKNCNKKLSILEKRKPKIFCSDNFRIAFWRKNKQANN